jgi:succinate-semialdehyde dehydrogenase / glutarate-semialdehyde dehydrogenase
MTTIATTNPATGEVEKTFDALTDDEVDRRIARAAQTFASYRNSRLEQRAEWMNAAADILDREADQIGVMLTTEMGKTLKAAGAEAQKCAKACRFYAGHAAEFLADRRPADAKDVAARDAYVRYEPLGPVLAVMPWNFPLWQVIRFAAPGLMAGNVGLLKHSSNVPQTALFLEDLFRRAGFPEGAFQTLLIGSSKVERVLRDPRVKAATLTGSEPAGRSVAAIAGDEVKPTVLELGGSDPFVVMPSAAGELDHAVSTAVTARVQNNGQSCIAAKRFIVHADIYDEFAAAFTRAMSALAVGDPTSTATDIGPLASEQGRTDIEDLVQDALAHGAEALCGARRPKALPEGWYYEPTVLAGVTPAMRIHREEAFGPVAALYRVPDLDAAVALANDTSFGLSSNVWTREEEEQRRFVRDLQAGGVYFNGMTASHPALPFGGVKRSGYGRELSGHGIRAFCNVTTVWYGR